METKEESKRNIIYLYSGKNGEEYVNKALKEIRHKLVNFIKNNGPKIPHT